MPFCRLLIFFSKSTVSKNYISVKYFRSRSSPTFCRALSESESKLFAKVISRRHYEMKCKWLSLVKNELCHYSEIFKVYSQGLVLVFSGAEIRTHSQWNLGDLFTQFRKKKSHSYFFKTGTFIQSTHTYARTHARTHTHTSYMVSLSFNLMSIVCVIANLFFIDQKMTELCSKRNFPMKGFTTLFFPI